MTTCIIIDKGFHCFVVCLLLRYVRMLFRGVTCKVIIKIQVG